MKLILCLTIALFSYFNLSSCIDPKSYKEKGGVAKAVIINIEFIPKNNSWSIYYSYSVKGITYSNTQSYPPLNQIRKRQLLHKQFPVAYLFDDPSKSIILITRYDFEQLGYNFPDSLNWEEEVR